ncbi:hypothetical protein DVH24_014426 [Malus domestica]|uniref:Uncharacterized protein n=1 Tax=Malus domestica TaxID=3750 RepID=A0A498KHU4_MALDO|nr:hypothetical protein DVH24_014426 [Malus domestica]
MAVWRRCCSKRWRGDWTDVLGFWRAGEEEARRQKAKGRRQRQTKAIEFEGLTRRLDALRRASATSASPAKHFAYSSKTEALNLPISQMR